MSKIFTLLLGSGLGHILTVLLTPFFMQVYSPLYFGEFAFFIALSGVIIPVLCLRFDAIVYVCNETELFTILLLGVGAALLLSFLIFSCLFFWGYKFSFLFFVSTFSLSSSLVLNNFLLRLNHYKLISVLKFLLSAFVPLFQVGFYYSLGGENGLIYGYTMAGFCFFIISLLTCLFFLRRDSELLLKFNLRKYKSYYTLNSLSVLMNSASNQYLPLSVSFLFGNVILGHINIVQRVLITPLGFVYRVIMQVYNKEFSESLRDKSNSALSVLKRFTCISVILTFFVVFFFLIVFNGDFFTFPEGWEGIYDYLYPLLILVLFQSFAIPPSQSLTFMNKHLLQLNVEFIRGGGLVFIFFLFVFIGGDSLSFLFSFVFFQCLIYFFLTLYICISVNKLKGEN